MASAIYAASSSYPPPPTFSQENTESVINGIHSSQSAINSFNGAYGDASTPTPTPPASRHQNLMPHSVPNYGQANGTYSQQSTPRHQNERKPTGQPQHYPPGQKLQIYTVWLPMIVIVYGFIFG